MAGRARESERFSKCGERERVVGATHAAAHSVLERERDLTMIVNAPSTEHCLWAYSYRRFVMAELIRASCASRL